MSKQTFETPKISLHVINEVVYVRLGYLQTVSVMFDEGVVSYHIVWAWLCAAIAEYRLNSSFGSLGIAHYLELKGGMTLCYMNKSQKQRRGCV